MYCVLFLHLPNYMNLNIAGLLVVTSEGWGNIFFIFET